MKKTAVAIVAILAVAVAGGAMVAAPGQATARPGDMTQARVWIENRGSDQALPVSIENQSAFSKPLRVEITGTPAVSIVPSTVVQVQARAVRQPWDHRTVTVAAGQDVGVALMQAGADGWEAVSAQLTASGGLTVLLKRPR